MYSWLQVEVVKPEVVFEMRMTTCSRWLILQGALGDF